MERKNGGALPLGYWGSLELLGYIMRVIEYGSPPVANGRLDEVLELLDRLLVRQIEHELFLDLRT